MVRTDTGQAHLQRRASTPTMKSLEATVELAKLSQSVLENSRIGRYLADDPAGIALRSAGGPRGR